MTNPSTFQCPRPLHAFAPIIAADSLKVHPPSPLHQLSLISAQLFEVESFPALLRPVISKSIPRTRLGAARLLETTNNKTEKKNNFNKTRRIVENGARTTRATTSTAQFIFFHTKKFFLCFTFSDGENTTVYLKTSCCAEGPLTLTEKRALSFFKI